MNTQPILRLLALIYTLCLFAVVSACAATPATRDSSPSSVATSGPTISFDSPLASLRSFLVASDRGDPETVRRVLYAEDETSKSYAAGLVGLAAAVKDVRTAAIAAIGKTEGDKVHTPFGPRQGSDPVAGATVSMDGNTAIVDRHDASIPLIRINGEWKLDIARMQSIRQYPGFVPRWKRVADAWRSLAEQVWAAKYKTASEVEDAMKVAELKAIAQADQEYRSRPTTRNGN